MNPRLLIAVAGAVTAGAGAWWRYQQDMGAARQRLARGRRVMTSAGQVEYAELGAGDPVLVVHGAGGGWDQGLAIAAPLADDGFRVIAPSRFGYLDTPLPPDPSVDAQAGAHRALLDHLEVERAHVIGVSAGAPSALELALRHPERVASLALLVPAAWHPTAAGPARQARFPAYLLRLLESDFAAWALTQFRQEQLLGLLGTPGAVLERAGAGERQRLAELTRTFMPVSARREGIRNDIRVVADLPRPPVEDLQVPLLTVSTPDDRLETAPGARWLAEHAPRGRYLELPSGGHLLVGQSDAAWRAVREWLDEHRPAPSAPRPEPGT